MIPSTFPDITTALSPMQVFGPLVPLAALAAVAGLAVLIGLLVADAWRLAHHRRRPTDREPAAQHPLRPAA